MSAKELSSAYVNWLLPVKIQEVSHDHRRSYRRVKTGSGGSNTRALGILSTRGYPDDCPVFSVCVAGETSGTLADCYNYDDSNDAYNANYISRANPQTILAIIERLEAAERDAVRYRWLARGTNPMRGEMTEVIVHAPNFERREDGRILSGYQLEKHIDTAIAAEQGK